MQILDLQSRFPELTVHWHNEPINSYGLIEESDFVFVGRSTLGHEASLMGKCVWVTAAARYDKIADVRQLHDPSQVTSENIQLWATNPEGARRFAAYWTVQDHPFTWNEDSWSTWDSFRPPPKLRLGQLLIKNPVAHKMHMIRLEIGRSMNKRFRPPNGQGY